MDKVVAIYDYGDNPYVTIEVAESLQSMLSSSAYRCTYPDCTYETAEGTVGDMLQELGEHGTSTHPYPESEYE